MLTAMEKTETKIVISPLPNCHYPSQEELRASTRRLIENPSWPFNPKFPQAFSFPDFGTAEWLAFSVWTKFSGDASKIPCADKIKAGNPLIWQIVWRDIFAHNPVRSPAGWIPNTTDYSMKSPEGWVQTLLDAPRFWEEINTWAMEMVEKEFKETNSGDFELDAYANFTDISDSKEKCEHFCRRFHTYQQARYRWHEHLLERHCERALGASHAYG